MLDKAIWRRFPYKIEFGLPDLELRQVLWQHFLSDCGDVETIVRILAHISDEMGGAEIEQYAFSARRKAILDKQPLDVINLAASILNRCRPLSWRFPSRRLHIRKGAHRCLAKCGPF